MNEKKKYTFRLLEGRHVEGKDADGKQIIYNAASNNIIHTDNDLSVHNRAPGKKFENITGAVIPVQSPSDTEDETELTPDQQNQVTELMKLKLDELKEMAEAEEIDTEGCSKKEDYAAALVTQAYS